MFATCRRSVFVPFRAYSTTNAPKASIKLVAELRKRTEVSLSKAREALTATDNDVDAALEWLHKDLALTGARKAAKVQDKTAREGLIGVSVLSRGLGSHPGAAGVRAAMVEVNCETDFVARNHLFSQLVADIAHTAAFVAEAVQASDTSLSTCSPDMLHDAPLLSPQNTEPRFGSTVGSAVHDLIAKVGEKILLRRAVCVVHDAAPLSQSSTLGLRVASHVHGGVGVPSQGRIGSLALLALRSPQLRVLMASPAFCDDLEKLERALARQIVGFDTRSVHASDTADETVLYNQPFMMLSGDSQSEPVLTVLQKWAKEKNMAGDANGPLDTGVQVLEFAKWTVGEEI